MSARTYELIYIMVPDANEQQVADLHAQVSGIVERMGGTIEKTDPWGRRKLAYEIGKHKEGFYVLHVIRGTGDVMKEIDRRLKVTDGLLRHLVVRVDERQEVADRARTKRQETSRRRRVARGLPAERQPGEGPQHENDDDADVTYDGSEGEA
ncbi:MAG: 30S ribosomal protein S6 [Acidobacteriota bacterium]|nr:30S ribosomal protein S6 [Acidobacteriota bacterium]